MHTSALTLALLLVIAAPALGQRSIDLSSCQDDLDTLKHKAADASDAAQSAESKLEDWNNCIANPGVYDIWHDGCKNRRSDYESALHDLSSSMDDVDSNLHSVQSSCGYEFTVGKMTSAEAAQRSLCNSLKRLASSLTKDVALVECKRSMSEQWCKTCLGTKP